MALLKKPAPVIRKRQYHIRIDEPLADKAERYAEFIDGNMDHVVSEALDYVFKKDSEFHEWLANHPAPATTKQAEALRTKPNGTGAAKAAPEMPSTARATI